MLAPVNGGQGEESSSERKKLVLRLKSKYVTSLSWPNPWLKNT